MKLFDLLYEKGFPKLTFKILLKLKVGDYFVIAPPNSHSFIIKNNGFVFKKQFRSDEFFFLSSFDLHEIEMMHFITVATINSQAYILSENYFIKESISTYLDIATNPTKYQDTFKVFDTYSLPHVIESIGYLNQNYAYGKLNSIREFLSAKSNDYSLIDFIWQNIFTTNITDYDAAEILMQNHKFNIPNSVSIIIPCFESNDTISNTVESALLALSLLPQSSFKEIIVVDDSRTLNVKFKQKEIKIISSDFKLHCGGARNVGMSVAKGENIFLIDSDTYIAQNYLINHILRHNFFPNFISVSMREQIKNISIPKVEPKINSDSRVEKTYSTEWKTLNSISESTTVMPLSETNKFKHFGFGKKLGPTDLPFMVKGNNASFSRKSIGNLSFCNKYEGWGPEDVSFAANLISKGFFVLPILSTGVFHVEHSPRSGSYEQKEKELKFNLNVHDSILNSHPYETW